ncbi:MAG: phosphate ABC transporter substrate-binding protein [Nitrospiria bacterium]
MILFLPIWAGAAESFEERLVLTGSSTIAPLVSEIGRLFEKKHPGIQVDVQTGGSSRGIADVRRNLADIGMVSRGLNKAEKDLHSFTIAFDGIMIIIHRNNSVTALSDREIIDIYRGRIDNWIAVGGRNAPITIVNKAEGRSTLELFLKYFKIKNREIRPHVVIGDNAQGIKTVAGNPDAIGYVSVGAAEYDAGQGVPIRLIPVSGVPASAENIQSGRYPIVRPLNLITRRPPEGLALSFIRFAQSQAVFPLVEEQYFVPFTK